VLVEEVAGLDQFRLAVVARGDDHAARSRTPAEIAAPGQQEGAGRAGRRHAETRRLLLGHALRARLLGALHDSSVAVRTSAVFVMGDVFHMNTMLMSESVRPIQLSSAVLKRTPCVPSRSSSGIVGAPMPMTDIPLAECIMVVGSNVAECFPIVMSWIWQARDRGARHWRSAEGRPRSRSSLDGQRCRRG